MKVAIYCRVSTEEQHADNQEKICKEHCKRNDIEIYKVYKDVISGSTSSRPSFNKLLVDMRTYKFDTIMVSKLDRIGRSLSHLISLFEEFNKRKVGFISLTQNIETITASGKLQFHILAAFSEYERDIISERTKEGLRYCKKLGKRGKDKTKRSNKGYKDRYK